MAPEGLFPGEGQRGAVGDYNNLKYPKLGDMLDYILIQQPALLETTEMREAKLLFPSKTYVAMIKFLLKCFEADAEQYRTVERILEYWPSVENMCLLLEHAMAYEGSVELHSNASKALITIGTYFQELVENVATCLIKIAEGARHTSDMLDELCKHGLIHQATHLIDLNCRTILCQPVYTGLIGLLVTLASSSIVAVRTLFELNISSILKDILSIYDLSHKMPSPNMVDGHCNQIFPK